LNLLYGGLADQKSKLIAKCNDKGMNVAIKLFSARLWHGL
jgi:hypothetical protein